MNRIAIILIVTFVLSTISCRDESSIMPRQRMYPYISYPVKHDTIYTNQQCGFSFVHADYLKYKKDSFFFGEKPANDCWFDLHSDQLNTTVYCSYYPIGNRKDLDSLIRDAFELTNKHNVKANARKESLINNAHGLGGLLFEVDGPVATPMQFFITDSTRHFFRAAVYFDAKVNPDSTAPVLNFIRSDIEKMILDFHWQK